MTTPLMRPLCAQATIATLGELRISTISMHIDGAWNCTDPTRLWIWSETKGRNRGIARAHGDKAFPWRIAAGTYSLPFLIEGIYDVGLAEYASNLWVGLQHNVEYLRENVMRPPAAPTPTRSAVLILPDGNAVTAGIQPRTFDYTPNGTETWPAVMQVIVPAGQFTPTAVPGPEDCTPTNDFIEGAIPITGDSGSLTVDMTSYWRERDEPDHCGSADDGDGNWSSAWWTYTATADGTLDLTTDGSDFDTLLAVYFGGPAMVDLNELDCDDDGGSDPGCSALSLSVTNGDFLYIAVAGYSGASGNAVLNWTFTP